MMGCEFENGAMRIVAKLKALLQKDAVFHWHAPSNKGAWHRAGRLSPPGHCAMPRFFCGFALVLAAAGCHRAPDEPVSHTNVAVSQATAPLPTAGGGCVVRLASAAPDVPKAAGDRCPADPTGPFKLRRARVAFKETGNAVDAELAVTPDADERGLMYRKTLGEEEGMFFALAGERRIQTFWMHNTCIPLDMLFIDEDGLIVGVVESAPVLDDGTRSVDCPSRFVLEVNAGWTRRHNVQPGQHVVIPVL